MRKKKTLLASLTAGALPVSAWSAGGHFPVDHAEITVPARIRIQICFSPSSGSLQ